MSGFTEVCLRFWELSGRGGADEMAGGYGAGSGQSDLSYIINDNNNDFIGITIQYRVGHVLPNRKGAMY